MTTIYIATKGSYSSYHIVSAFLDKEQAYALRELHNKRHNGAYDDVIEIEEFIADGEPDESKGYFSVWLSPITRLSNLFIGSSPSQKHGETHTIEIYANDHEYGGDYPEMMKISFEKGGGDPYPSMNIPYAEAKDDPEVAKKIFIDALKQYEAEQAGIA